MRDSRRSVSHLSIGRAAARGRTCPARRGGCSAPTRWRPTHVVATTASSDQRDNSPGQASAATSVTEDTAIRSSMPWPQRPGQLANPLGAGRGGDDQHTGRETRRRYPAGPPHTDRPRCGPKAAARLRAAQAVSSLAMRAMTVVAMFDGAGGCGQSAQLVGQRARGAQGRATRRAAVGVCPGGLEMRRGVVRERTRIDQSEHVSAGHISPSLGPGSTPMRSRRWRRARNSSVLIVPVVTPSAAAMSLTARPSR